jgi:hypothetical protein
MARRTDLCRWCGRVLKNSGHRNGGIDREKYIRSRLDAWLTQVKASMRTNGHGHAAAPPAGGPPLLPALNKVVLRLVYNGSQGRSGPTAQPGQCDQRGREVAHRSCYCPPCCCCSCCCCCCSRNTRALAGRCEKLCCCWGCGGRAGRSSPARSTNLVGEGMAGCEGVGNRDTAARGDPQAAAVQWDCDHARNAAAARGAAPPGAAASPPAYSMYASGAASCCRSPERSTRV